MSNRKHVRGKYTIEEHHGLAQEQYYSVDVSLLGKLQDSSGDELTILPGMVATIEVLSGKRSILDYFWQPLVKNKEIAFRE